MIDNRIRMAVNQQNSFDFIRYFLSFTVLFVHFGILSGTKHFVFITSSEAVQGFFILSGFLVFYSYINHPDPKKYFIKRSLRILPAYFLIVLLCAIGGVFLTDLPVFLYFTSPMFFKYLVANICFLNFLQPELPGVFAHNIIQAVNGSLWTMKVEILLYFTVPVIYWLFKKYNKILVLFLLFAFSTCASLCFSHLYDQTGKQIYNILNRQVGSQLIYFYSGTAILLYFNYFQRYIKYLFVLAFVLYVSKFFFSLISYVEPMCMAIIIIGFAYHSKPFYRLTKYDNIAYGIYLFHFPIIQMILRTGWQNISYYMTLLIVVLCTVALALASWYILEKPILKHK